MSTLRMCRVPDLLLAIKVRVDRDPEAGPFLLAGSANVLTAPRIANALAARGRGVRIGCPCKTAKLGTEALKPSSSP